MIAVWTPPATPMDTDPITPTPTRLFVALTPDLAVRNTLAAWRDAWPWRARATPVADARLHMTLHFLGDVAPALLVQLLPAIAMPFEPFKLEFGRTRLWQHGIAVLEPLAVPPALATLHAHLQQALQQLGLTTDPRPFAPHVTLARRVTEATSPVTGPAFTWHVDQYCLMASQRDLVGRYATLARYPAAKPGR